MHNGMVWLDIQGSMKAAPKIPVEVIKFKQETNNFIKKHTVQINNSSIHDSSNKYITEASIHS